MVSSKNAIDEANVSGIPHLLVNCRYNLPVLVLEDFRAYEAKERDEPIWSSRDKELSPEPVLYEAVCRVQWDNSKRLAMGEIVRTLGCQLTPGNEKRAVRSNPGNAVLAIETKEAVLDQDPAPLAELGVLILYRVVKQVEGKQLLRIDQPRPDGLCRGRDMQLPLTLVNHTSPDCIVRLKQGSIGAVYRPRGFGV
jgi:hypothetical protein